MDQPQVLSCTFSIKVDRPASEVFDAVYRVEHLRQYFAYGAKGNLDPGAEVSWHFHDFPDFGPFPVRVLETKSPKLIHLQWESNVKGEWNDVRITFEPLDNPAQTLVRVTESGWPKTDEGIKGAIDNAGGWANMATCLKAYVENGWRLRDFAFGASETSTE